MKRVSAATKMRVLGAIEFAPGNSIRAKIDHVSTLVFKDEEGDPLQFTWRTIQTWYSRYKKDGITTMKPKPRSDRGHLRKVEPELVQEAIDQVLPHFRGPSNLASIYRACIEKNLLQRESVAPNTFRRIVARYDMLKATSETKNKARLAFSKAHANQLWQADTMCGPYVSHKGKKLQAKLIAFIDDASRVCCHGGQNCKPNHISIMNYLYGAYLGGIPFETNGTTSNYYIDFSPSKVPDDQIVISTAAALRCPPGSNGCNRRLPLLPTYHEGLLDDTTPMLIEDVDSGVLLRQLLLYASPYSSSPDAVFEGHLYDPIDWDATPATQGTAYSGNPDIVSALEGAQGCGVDRNSSQTYHHNLDEWSRIIMAAGRGVLGQDLIADPNKFSVDAHRPFEPAFFMPRREKMLKTDLIVVGFLNPTPIAIGEAAQLQIDVANVGMRTASNGYVEVILPEGTVTSVTPERCEEQSSLVYLCSLGYFSAEEIELRPLAAGSNTSFTFDLVFQAIPTGAKRDIVLSVIHEGVDTNPEDNIHIVEVLTLPSFFGFDDQSRPWSQAYSNGSVPLTTTTSNVTAGQRSGVFGCGFNSYETPTFDTMELSFASETLVLDVWVPESVGQGWVGEVQLFAHIPSAAIYDAWISLKSLNTLPRGEWSQLHFAIPQQIQSALLGDFPDARLKLSVNVGSCSDPILIDSLRFAGESTVRTVYHPSNSALVASSSVLTFDELADWHLVGGSGGTLALDDTDYIEGTAALALSPGNFSRIESREFSTTELEQVTETISLEVGIPELPPDYYWLGQMNLFIECPSAELWQTFLGYQPLQILFDGEYNRVEYTIPQHVLNVLGGEFNDCKFMIDVSSNSGYTPILLDGGGFVQ